jgi:UDP-glucose-4-epimerase GalE
VGFIPETSSDREANVRVLVVGGAGYIGSHTCLALAEAGHEPVVYDNLAEGHEWAVNWGPLVCGDLADGEKLQTTLRDEQIEAVIHFAAFAYVGESVQNPRKYFANNVGNTLNLLNAMLDTGVRDIIFSSSCATFGVPDRVPIDETQSQSPINPYGETKLMVEKILKWYGQAYDLNWMALRYFNAAGADPDGRIGESHDPETHLIPLVIEATLGKRGPVQIFGTDYPTPDGTNIRDYVHVMDLADAHIRALEHIQSSGDSQGLNIGTGRGYSVREVIDSVKRVSGREVPFSEGPRRPGDPPELVADPSRAMDILDWRPRYTEFDDIVQTAWNWHSRES